jgi:hypothetical protein
MSCNAVSVVHESTATITTESPIRLVEIERDIATIEIISEQIATVEIDTPATISVIVSPTGTPGPAGSTVLQVEADCLVTDAVGDCVYIRGASISGRFQVERADISDALKMPAVGLIASKQSATSCNVLLNGIATLTGLIPGKPYFVSDTGPITSVRPVASGVAKFVQHMGVALDATRLSLSPNHHMTKVIP